MARLITSLAAFLAVLLFASATAYARRTTISSAVEIDEQSCREQIRSEYPRSCRLYIIKSPLRIMYDVLCCQEMRRLDDECQCEALEQLVRDVQEDEMEYEEGERLDMQDVKKRAENVPVYCKLQQRCKIQSGVSVSTFM